MGTRKSKPKKSTSASELSGTTTALFYRLLDTVYPVLNRLHGFEGSRRFWAILLYRDLLKQIGYLAGNEPILGRQGMPKNEASRFGLRDARYLPGELIRRATVNYLLRSSLASSRSIVTGFHHLHTISRCVKQPASLLRSSKWRGTIDHAARPALEDMTRGIDFPLARVALESLSSRYVEEFQSLYDAVEVTDPCGKEFHASFLPGIDMRMIIARHVEEGSRLSFYQHAAAYGEVLGHTKHHIEAGFSDRFRTWGWKLCESDEPFVALRLMQPPQLMFRTKRGATNWLLIIVKQPRSSQLKVTLEVQRRFFGVLREKCAARIVVRPRGDKGALAEGQLIDGLQARVRAIDTGTSRLADLVKDAELVILDNFPSTTFMECLISNVPVIAIVPEGTQFTANATRFYDEFYRLGLLHSTPESAAQFLNQLSVRSWWQDEVAGLDCVHEYLNTFCNRDLSKVSA